MRRLLCLLFLLSTIGQAQFSSTAAHIRYGSSFPAHCNPKTGDVFALVTGTTAAYYNCTAVDTWTAAGGGGGYAGCTSDGSNGITCTGNMTSALFNGATFYPVTVLAPTTSPSIHIGQLYNFSAAHQPFCPTSGGGDSGGTYRVSCYTIDGTSWITASGRQWAYPFTGACQGAISGANIQLPSVYGASLNACAATTEPEWSIAAAGVCPTLTTAGCQYWWETIMALPVANPWLTIAMQYRTTDTTVGDAISLEVYHTCLTVGSVPDAPSYTADTTVTLNPSGVSGGVTQTTFGLPVPTCPAGDDLRLQFVPTVNTLSAAINFSRASVTVWGGPY